MQGRGGDQAHPHGSGRQAHSPASSGRYRDQAAVADHVIGGGRFIFGFGSGFPSPLFSDERGLSYEDRHERLRKSLDLILKCWAAKEPFDWDGKHWRGKGIVATPPPLRAPHMPMATATDTPAMIDLAAARGYTMLRAQLEPAGSIRKIADRYMHAAKAAGQPAPLGKFAVARYVYLADSRRQAMDDLRADINYELTYQIKRGLIRMLARNYGCRSMPTRSLSISSPKPASITSAIRIRWRRSCASSTRPPAASAHC